MSTGREAPVIHVQFSETGRPGELPTPLDLSSIITSLRYKDDEKRVDMVTLSVDNHDLSQFDNGIWEAGVVLEISWGYAGNMSPVRKCVIKKVNGRNPLSIEAHVIGVLLDSKRSSRTFSDMKRSDIIKQIATESGYGPERQHIQETSVVVHSVTQAALTNAQFAKTLANKQGFQFFIDFDGFHWHERKTGQRPIREYVWFSDPGQGDIIDWGIEKDHKRKPTSCTFAGRDPFEKKDIVGTADNSSVPRTALGELIEGVDAKTGASLGTRAMNTAHDERFPSSARSNDEATEHAAGRYKNARLNTNKLWFHVVGDPGLVGKSIVSLANISRSLSGKYYVTELEHIIDGEYQTHFKCLRDASGSGVAPVDAPQNTEKPAGGETLEPFDRVDKFGVITVEYRHTGGRT